MGVQGRTEEIIRRLDHNQHTIRMAEIGVYRGLLAFNLLTRLPNLEMVLIDNWAGISKATKEYINTGDDRAMDTPEQAARYMQETIELLDFARDRTEIYKHSSLRAAGLCWVGQFDMIFIDADHSYEAVLVDIAAWHDNVKPGGYIGGHDYQPKFAGVIKAVDYMAVQLGSNVETGADNTWFMRRHW